MAGQKEPSAAETQAKAPEGTVRPVEASIRAKMIILSTVLLLATVGTFGFISMRQSERSIDAYADRLRQSINVGLRQAGRAQLKLLATATRIALLQSDYGSLKTIAQDLIKDDPRITAVGIFDTSGRPLASLGGKIADAATAQRLVHASTEITLPELTVGSTRSIAFAAPIRYGERSLGAVSLAYSLKTLEAELAAAERIKVQAVSTTLRNTGLVALLAALIGTLLTILQGHRISRPIRLLASQASRVAGGDFGGRVQIKSRDELGQLGDIFNHMSGRMVSLMADAQQKAALEREFELANAIQASLIPEGPLAAVGGLEIASFFESASECGGDWWSYFKLPDEKALVVIGDVTGHGVPAAMITAVVKGAASTLYSRVSKGDDLAPFLTQLNSVVREVGKEKFFMSCFALLYDARNGEGCFANAGHTFPYVRSAPDNAVSALVARGGWLGQAGEPEYQINQASFKRGDMVVGYTDGLVEMENGAGQEYGYARLRRLLSRRKAADVTELKDLIVKDVYGFADGEPLKDDVTLVVARVV